MLEVAAREDRKRQREEEAPRRAEEAKAKRVASAIYNQLPGETCARIVMSDEVRLYSSYAAYLQGADQLPLALYRQEEIARSARAKAADQVAPERQREEEDPQDELNGGDREDYDSASPPASGGDGEGRMK